MNERAIRRSWQLGRLVFVALVTACLLSFVFDQAARGFDEAPGMVVWSLSAGFGLEFVSSSWRALGRS